MVNRVRYHVKQSQWGSRAYIHEYLTVHFKKKKKMSKRPTNRKTIIESPSTLILAPVSLYVIIEFLLFTASRLGTIMIIIAYNYDHKECNTHEVQP